MSWQVYPRRLVELTTSPDSRVCEAAMAATMKQTRIVIAEIEAAVAAA